MLRIMESGQAGIDRGLFPNGSKARDVADTMIGEALQYTRQLRNTGSEFVICNSL